MLTTLVLAYRASVPEHGGAGPKTVPRQPAWLLKAARRATGWGWRSQRYDHRRTP